MLVTYFDLKKVRAHSSDKISVLDTKQPSFLVHFDEEIWDAKLLSTKSFPLKTCCKARLTDFDLHLTPNPNFLFIRLKF